MRKVLQTLRTVNGPFKVGSMKKPSNVLRRSLFTGVAVAFGVVFAGYAIPNSTKVLAQQQAPAAARPRGGAPAAGGSQNATGGAAAGPGEGAQAVAADPEHGQAPAGPAARGGLVAYPDRPKAPAAVLERGKANFGVNCAFCHGSDAGGGSVGPNLLRSEVVLQDKDGELIMPIVHGARVEKGMPKIDINDAQVKDIAAWLHSLKVSSRAVMTEKINIVVGNANEGKAAFDRTCGSCHSVSGDLKGFAAKYTDPRAMQQAWMLPGGAGGRGGPGPAGPQVQLHVPPVTATVTASPTQKVTGRLEAIDDFYVSVVTDDGETHRWTRNNGMPKVDIHDPLAEHRALMRKYNDKDIHDITAYLVSLK
ncbi:Cytochrome c, mono-and diheme variants [Terriglobus roseus]|uniref:Cytochrome c, mono-and diheme variants n=2 Tax=Terriglobus roseus TaxID=392734 RepID=A0A1H4MC29_9BACT|nr:Cytochrome c, mono-and diheme variants [Terriglobus roseus]